MRKHKNIWASFVLAAALSAGMLSGCGQKAAENQVSQSEQETAETTKTSAGETSASEEPEESSEEAEEMDGSQKVLEESPNPMKEAEGPEAFEALGIYMAAPEGAEGLQYFILNGVVADMRFTLDGKEYTLRASNTAEDFAGIFERFKEEVLGLSYEGEDGGASIEIKTTESGGRLALWTFGETDYTLYTAEESTDEEISSVVMSTAEMCRRKDA